MFRDENVTLFWWGILVGMSSVGSVILVERTPWCWPRMCPFAFPQIQVLCNVFFIDEWPREIISFANGIGPGGFCWEAYRTMEVPNSGFNAGVLLAVILAHLECYMFAGDLVCFNEVHGVEAVLSGWMI